MNKPRQYLLDIHREIMVDLFAGGGGMSKSFLMALGRHPDIAINHNDDALSMHRLNHPQTRHFVADVFEVDPRTVCQSRPVGHLHASPDCTHHSQAAGGQPRNEKRRALSWVVTRWAGQVKPRVITLENVKQVLQWGPLVAKRDKVTGRVIKLDGSIANPGERVPLEQQYLVPDPKHKGRTWRQFVHTLEAMGYEVKTQMLCAADYGAGTTRDRLFLHARNDGLPVTFPEPTHFKNPKRGQKRWSAAHEHIDFNLPAQSIFERKKPLAPATLRRIAKGMHKFVLNNPDPFIIQVTQSSANGVHDINDPLNTITTAKGGEFAIVSPVMVQAGHGEGSGKTKRWGEGVKSAEDSLGTIMASGGGHAVATAVLVTNTTGHPGTSLKDPVTTLTTGGQQALATAHLQSFYGDKSAKGDDRSKDINDPVHTITTENRHGLVTAFLSQMKFDAIGRDMSDPVPTITSGGNSKRDAGAAHSLGLVAGSLVKLRGDNIGQSLNDPLATMSAGGQHHGLVEYELSDHDCVIDKALRVSAFLVSYYGTDNMSQADEPLPTITTKDRLALVTVIYRGTPYLIVDITLRMLKPKELYSAQGFDSDYVFTHGHDGRAFSVADQVRMVGNSVSPYPGAALIRCCHANDEMRLVA